MVPHRSLGHLWYHTADGLMQHEDELAQIFGMATFWEQNQQKLT